jgi:hypothetical protein
MRNAVMKRLAKLESSQHDNTVKAISNLMDELSDIAAGGDGKGYSEPSLESILEVDQ